MKAITVGLAALLLSTASSFAAQAWMEADAGGSKIFTDAKGMTLYTFDRDTTPGKSSCNGGCLAAWPALTASADAKDMGAWTVITRDDGTKQWAHKGKPLYTYAKDTKAGDNTGDKVGNVWHTATP